MNNINHTEPQTARIKEYLLSGKAITPLEALNMFGCFRLSARINDLKKIGMDIVNIPIKGANGKRFASYRLAS